MQGPDKQNKVL